MTLLEKFLFMDLIAFVRCFAVTAKPNRIASNHMHFITNLRHQQHHLKQQIPFLSVVASRVASTTLTPKITYQPKHLLTTTTRTTTSDAPINCYNQILVQRRKMATMCEEKPKLVSLEEARRFMVDCFSAVNVPKEHAEAMADLLVAADYRGHQSHGMNRLEMYLNDLQSKVADGAAVPVILKETAATAWVDGCNGLGAVVGNFCMDLAIKKAKEVGVGWVCAKGSNHYGIAGWYAMRAMANGLIGISMTNTSPLMAPTRSKTAALGTNPIAVGANASNGDSFLLDMATTAVAVGKIEIQRRKDAPLPPGWAQNPEGNVTTDAELAFKTGCLMPLGGAEISAGYKGYGLGAMVDMLTGVMAGANYSTMVRKWSHAGAKEPADLGQVFIAVDQNCFAPCFEERLSDFNGRLRDCTPADPAKPVLVAGEVEKMVMKSIDEAGGIKYLENQLKTCQALAERLCVEPLAFV